MSSPPVEPSPGSLSERLALRVRSTVSLARDVAFAEPSTVEAAALRLGSSRRYLAPIAWAAGTLILLLAGIRLLIRNWRLTFIELLPAAWVWLAMWDLKQHTLRGEPFRDLHLPGMLALSALTVVISIAALWCNTVFAFAIENDPPWIRPAARRANTAWRAIVVAGVAVGVVLAVAVAWVPRTGSGLLFLAVLGATLAIMLTSFVTVPARIVGNAGRKKRLVLRETVGSWTASGALSAVAMTPGFVLDRVGLVLIGLPGFRILGFVLLSLGTTLYAAGMTSARAVKLTVKLSPGGGPRATVDDDGTVDDAADDAPTTSEQRSA
ncbi:hypothetical protein [Luteimicrobium subarcticum]|uniref:hypothetical protein n=1 Tax=Luteimicrobium subarcticum TaxID=620910 RepID=UPI000C24698E|nr:hypothetical protein [Luteimicrobium subarcticum]